MAFSNCRAEHAVPRRPSLDPPVTIPINEGVPSISAKIGAPSYPKFVKHRKRNAPSSAPSLRRQSRTTEGRYLRSSPYPICKTEPELETVANWSRGIVFTETGLMDSASLSTMTAQSVAVLSGFQLSGEKSLDITRRFATEWAAGNGAEDQFERAHHLGLHWRRRGCEMVSACCG
jgi:hypothetical protein